jgi:hypothetical protein
MEMILVDANLLLYAKISNYPQHLPAKQWLEKQLQERPVGLSWVTLLAFVRLITHPKLSTQPLPIEAAWQQVEEWLASPMVWIPSPTERHGEILGKLLCGTHAAGNLVTDAHLAALAMEHNLILCSCDRDFLKFEPFGLKWQNPLQFEPSYSWSTTTTKNL